MIDHGELPTCRQSLSGFGRFHIGSSISVAPIAYIESTSSPEHPKFDLPSPDHFLRQPHDYHHCRRVIDTQQIEIGKSKRRSVRALVLQSGKQDSLAHCPFLRRRPVNTAAASIWTRQRAAYIYWITIYIYIIYIYICICVYIYIYIYMCMCIYIYVYVYVCIYIYICICICIHTCVYVM